ncbi:---NA--- [Octopus vulgaris]|uniref:---NA n=1 Tax=Octopus vulgaris TaxID=6645 RepID=A0AA36EYY3_OCTVU|nr:---NA--- [Octopus vulgaris]
MIASFTFMTFEVNVLGQYLKPHHCDICGKTFFNNCDLSCYRYTHTGEKLYYCDICGKTFFHRSNIIYKHTQERNHSIVMSMGKNSYRFDICDITFSHKTNLVLVLVHTIEKPYCDI